MRLIPHARPIPAGFRYVRGLLVQRVERLRRGSQVEEIVGYIEPLDSGVAWTPDPDVPGWNGAGSDVDGRDLEVNRG